MNPQKFKKIVLDHYARAGRHSLPWRKTRDPYRILVSEIMLQQTQVSRVLAKYPEFLKAFPNLKALAKAPTARLLKIWQGLGYNRRALNLKKAARSIVKDFKGVFPKSPKDLESLPGIGQSTRGAIMAFAFGIPSVFIETNIRTAYIHSFFAERKNVHDKEIIPLVEKTINKNNPRDWYYALMDYGVHLKKTQPNPSRKSFHHSVQKPFKGSNRELRSRILKLVLKKPIAEQNLSKEIGRTRHAVDKNIENLIKEGFIERKRGYLYPQQ